jgi:hypothetical protein
LEGVIPFTRNGFEYELFVSSGDGWTDGGGKPVLGSISSLLCVRTTEGVVIVDFLG